MGADLGKGLGFDRRRVRLQRSADGFSGALKSDFAQEQRDGCGLTIHMVGNRFSFRLRSPRTRCRRGLKPLNQPGSLEKDVCGIADWVFFFGRFSNFSPGGIL